MTRDYFAKENLLNCELLKVIFPTIFCSWKNYLEEAAAARRTISLKFKALELIADVMVSMESKPANPPAPPGVTVRLPALC